MFFSEAGSLDLDVYYPELQLTAQHLLGIIPELSYPINKESMIIMVCRRCKRKISANVSYRN